MYRRGIICFGFFCALIVCLSAQTTGLPNTKKTSAEALASQAGSVVSSASQAGSVLSSASQAGSVLSPAGEQVTNRLETPVGQALMAATTADYPVTPGDVYTLAFLKGGDPSSITVFVEPDYLINMSVFGRLDAHGLLFRDLKANVEALVERSYPGSSPSLLISGTGVFNVKVEGEVVTSGLVQVWGLTRLSEIVTSSKTDFASIRNVRIVDTLGNERQFDLFKASRFGDIGQDPYLRPGDRIVLSKYSRQVTLSGEVRRPGSYQLLEGEELKDLIEIYGDGFTDKGNPARLSLLRYGFFAGVLGEKRIIDYSKDTNIPLINYDEITVSSTTDLLPSIFFEGAIGVGVNGESPQAANRLPYIFYPGERLSQAVLKMRYQFSAVSDIKNAYLIRENKRITVDLSKYIFENDFSDDVTLAENDEIIVPFRQFFVSVAGAVKTPGRYPFIPDRDWYYYVNLAGGIDEDKNSGQALKIIDSQGKEHEKNRTIEPEDSIVVASNSFLYSFGRVSAIVSTTISVTALIISVIELMPK
jgi:protein involved in polysaccharide export with SLBB domain